MNDLIERLRYYAALAGKTPQEIQEIERSLIETSWALNHSLEDVAWTFYRVFKAYSTDSKSSSKERRYSSEMTDIFEKTIKNKVVRLE